MVRGVCFECGYDAQILNSRKAAETFWTCPGFHREICVID